jgi:hypothetical protein
MDTLAKISENSKRVYFSGSALLISSIVAEFRPLIETAIPDIVHLLKASHKFVQETATGLLLKLLKQSK